MTSTQSTGSLRVSCPFCGAKPGRKCQTIQARVEVDNVHPSRAALVAAMARRENIR